MTPSISSDQRAAIALKKRGEYAPGIPTHQRMAAITGKRGAMWPFVVQTHNAARAGVHEDMRMGPGFSWATKHLPAPGEKTLAIRQPDHSPDYFKFEGTIPEGTYGAGTVKRERLETIELTKPATSSKISFNAYPAKRTEEYTLIKMKPKLKGKGSWLLLNRTPVSDIPLYKSKYRSMSPADIDYDSDNILQAKIDGAHVVVVLSNNVARIFSYRKPAGDAPPIQHTDRVEGLRFAKAPPLSATLRGELAAVIGRKVLPVNKLSGLMNAGVIKSREMQHALKTHLVCYLFDVERVNGKPYKDKPYKEKLEILKKVSKSMPKYFRLPPSAIGVAAKQRLFEAVHDKTLPESSEGFVLWDPDKAAPATKAKFRPEYDVKVDKVFTDAPGKKLKQASGFEYHIVQGRSTKPSKVGTGFSRSLRKRMFREPTLFKGLIAKVRAQEQLPSGSLRAPSFTGWHPDKNATLP